MKTRLTIVVTTVSALALSLFLTGCHTAPGNSKGTPPLPVKVSSPLVRKVTEYSDLTGRTAAIDSVEVRARVWGYVDRLNFKEGMLVKKGDVLFEIDPRTYKASLAQAEGKLATAVARVDRLDLDFERARRLITSNTIAQAEYDQVGGIGILQAALSGLAAKNAILIVEFARDRQSEGASL